LGVVEIKFHALLTRQLIGSEQSTSTAAVSNTSKEVPCPVGKRVEEKIMDGERKILANAGNQILGRPADLRYPKEINNEKNK
jgi:hypothetical protein